MKRMQSMVARTLAEAGSLAKSNGGPTMKTYFACWWRAWLSTPLFLATVLCSQLAGAATLTVTTLNDSGPGSLRNTIAAATAGDTINFAVTGTISLTSGELVINKNLDIVGSGADGLRVQRSFAGGTPAFRVFNVTSGTVNILFLTIANGNALGNGGGIASGGSLNVAGCIFSGNHTAASGGALSLSGAATITGCTFFSNTAINGGAIFNNATLIINNSTLFGNGDSAIVNTAGTMQVLHCTISGNTNGIWNNSTVSSATEVNNTIIAGNNGVGGFDVKGPFLSTGFNLIGATNNSVPGNTVWLASDLTGSAAAPLDPRLGTLRNNGGQAPAMTLTMALLPGSPALDAGTAGGFATDQRTYTIRPYDIPGVPNATGGDASDIGAMEMIAINRLVTNTNDSGPGSLRAEIAGTSFYEGDIITFASNVVGAISLTTGELAVNHNLSIIGPGSQILSVSGNDASTVFSIFDAGAVISGLTIRNGRALGSSGNVEQQGFNGRGGGIYNQGILFVENCVVRHNRASGGTGGSTESGVAGDGGKGMGGGIYNVGALSLTDCLVTSNTVAGGHGGQAESGFAGGGGNGLGGGICSIGGSLTLTHCNLAASSATGGTGGVATGGGSDAMGGQGWGGALYSEGTSALKSSTVSGSRAVAGPGNGGTGSGVGGGIYNVQNMVLSACTVASNTATGSAFDFGGGIYDEGTLTLRSCTVAGNSAGFGGGLSGNADLGNTILANNTDTSGNPDGLGSINSSDYNLIQNINGLTFTGVTTHNITGQNPLLGPLADYGGPTPTMALRAGSPALDQGKSFGLTTDQRGLSRTLDDAAVANAAGGDGTDIGAFEVGTAIPTALLAVDGATAIPGGTANFTSLPSGPSLSGSSIAFYGAGSGGQQGIYVQNRFITVDPVRIADLNTPIPNGSGNFLFFASDSGLSIVPDVSGDEIAFYGTGSGGQRGIYALIGGTLLCVANTFTSVPGGSGNYTRFTPPGQTNDPIVQQNDLVALCYRGRIILVPFYLEGRYIAHGATHGACPPPPPPCQANDLIAQQNDDLVLLCYLNRSVVVPFYLEARYLAAGATCGACPQPLPPPEIEPPPDVSISGQNVAFFGAGAGGQQGVYARRNGVLTKIADKGTAIPGGAGMFTSIPNNPMISGENVVFVGTGSGGQQGVYLSKAGSLSVIADTQTAIPNGVGNFVAIPQEPAIGGDRVAFVGNGSGGQQGVYLVPDVGIPPNPIKVADTQTAIPGGVGNFTGFGTVSVSESDVAFLGTGASGQTGIYDLTGGQLIKAIAVGDTISGKTVSGLNFTRSGLFGHQIAFQATFDDGSQALYTIAVVAPPVGSVIIKVWVVGYQVHLRFTGIPGRIYYVERAHSVTGPWPETLAAITMPIDGVVEFTDTTAFSSPQSFYRTSTP